MKHRKKSREAGTQRSVETRYEASREELLRSLMNLDRRAFLRASGAAAAAALTHGVAHAHTFQPVTVAGASAVQPFRFAYISDSHPVSYTHLTLPTILRV